MSGAVSQVQSLNNRLSYRAAAQCLPKGSKSQTQKPQGDQDQAARDAGTMISVNDSGVVVGLVIVFATQRSNGEQKSAEALRKAEQTKCPAEGVRTTDTKKN